MKAVFAEAAWEELQEAVAYYDAQRAGLGDELVAEVHRAVEHIEDFPDAWQELAQGIRRCRLKRFPYGLVYQAQEERILILAVMHLRRKPGYWRGRN